MIDNCDINQILDILENLEDEVLAVELLAEFNRATTEHGRLLLNLDGTLTHEEWKSLCDLAQKRIEAVIKKINAL